MEWLYILASTIIALQGWILVEVIGLKMKTAGYDAQINRLVSDADSEKGTRKRLHDDFEKRLRAVEHDR